jgi:thioesterase domain-containing protein
VFNRLRREITYHRAGPDARREMLTHWIQSAYVRAVGRYRTSRYLGHVLHLKCTDSERFQNQSDLAWKQAVPNVQIEYLDCTHAEALQRPHVATVANAILRELNARHFSGALQGLHSAQRNGYR